MKQIQYLPGVSTLRLDSEKCVGCGNCREVCPRAVLAIDARKARIQDIDACMECGACMNNCPAKAIELHPGVGCAAFIMLGWLGFDKNVAACG
jgi:NAD-dependent dihydropyrimidine dehydrogenase PreA subunit